jgi:predicted phosphodiesterase
MRIVICSDVHGNVVALEAVLQDIRRHAAPDALIVAGDMAMVGPRPAEAVALLRGLDALFLMGNCDQYIVEREDDEQVQFALARLSDADMAFLADLPFGQQLEAAPGHELLVVHANPRNLEDPIKPDIADSLVRPLLEGITADVVAFGHYHVPFTRHLDPWTLVDVASVGMPRDGDRRAVYAVLTWDGAAWQVEHRRVSFDIEAVARDYKAVGFPDAERAAAALLRARY